MCTRRTVLAMLLPAAAYAQTLAHPGWRGNGIAPEAWWRRGVFVRFDPNSTFAQVTGALNTMSEAGADKLLLPDLLPPVRNSSEAEETAVPFRRRFGTEEELDALLREASARRMHVLLGADLLRLASSPGELRFWLNRGIAGFHVGDVRPAELDTLQLLRGAMDRSPGRRVVLLHPMSAEAAASIARSAPLHTTATLPVLSAAEASGTRDSVLLLESTDDVGRLPAHPALLLNNSLLADEPGRGAVRAALNAHPARATSNNASTAAAHRRHRQ